MTGRYAAETYNLHDLGRTATRLRCRRYAAGLPVSAATRGAETGGRRLTKHNINNNTTTTTTMTFCLLINDYDKLIHQLHPQQHRNPRTTLVSPPPSHDATPEGRQMAGGHAAPAPRRTCAGGPGRGGRASAGVEQLRRCWRAAHAQQLAGTEGPVQPDPHGCGRGCVCVAGDRTARLSP